MTRHFNHRTAHDRLDPAFLREEHRMVKAEHAALHVMERHRDHLIDDLERARSLAGAVGVTLRPVLEAARKLLMVIGVGNPLRGDDAAGIEVARRLSLARPPGVMVLEQEGEPATLLEAWAGADEALIVDGVSSGSPPGTLHRFVVTDEPLPAELFRPSTHALGVAEAVELARELGRLPRRLSVYGIEGESFDAGDGLTPLVQAAVERLVLELCGELGGRGGEGASGGT
jgi:hydrogenase maturation protease